MPPQRSAPLAASTGPAGADVGGLRPAGGPRVPDLSQLDRFLDDLVIEAELARTPRAVLYQVRTGSAEEQPLVLKVALAPGSADELARFRHEVRLLSEVRHPNVVEVHDYGVLPGGYPFLTMDRVSPQPLREVFREADWPQTYDLVLQAAAGLAHIHRHGILHLDLKPENLGLLEVPEGARLKILDFGMARSLEDPLDRCIRGTLAYAAPEIVLQDRYDHRADLYSLGLTLFELITGVLPSAGDDLAALRFHLEGERPDPRSLRPGTPEPLAAVLSRLLARDPGKRFVSAGKLLVEVGKAAGRSIDAGELVLADGRVLASRMVAREEPLAALRSELRRAVAGQGRLVLVDGEEGVGKSRLVREFRLFAVLGGARVGRGRATGDRAQPLRPVLEALEGLGLAPPALVPPPADDVASADRFQVYQAIAKALEAVGEGGGAAVVLIEDLHLAGRETEELLAYLAGLLLELPVLVVATRRPASGAVEEGDDPLLEADGLVHLHLSPLSLPETAALLDACLGSEGLPETFCEWVFEQSRGYPARIQQLLRHLIDEGVLRFRGGEWKPSLSALSRWAGGGALEAVDWQRLTHLGPGERHFLEAAVVAGEPLSLGALATLLDEPPETTYETVDRLLAEGFVERLEETGGAVYAVASRRLGGAIYAGLENGRRSELHRRCGELLAQRLERGEDLAGAVAEHLWRAGDRDRSLPYLLDAASRAAQVYGYGEAASLYGRAIEASLQVGDTETAVRSMAAQAEALAAGGHYGRALRVYHELLRRPEARGHRAAERVFAARLWLRKGRLHSRMGEHDTALESFETGLFSVAEAGEPELEVDLLHGKASALQDLGRLDAAFACGRAALRLAGRQGFVRPRGRLLNMLGSIYASRGEWRRAERLVRRGLRGAEATGDLRLVQVLRNSLGQILWQTGRYDEAHDSYSENLHLCRRTHDVWGELTTLANLGVLECSRGNWSAARGPLTRSLTMKRRVGAREAEALGRLQLGEVEEVLGDWPRARRHYTRALALLEEETDHPHRLALLAQLASLDRKCGNGEEAERGLREALAAAERIGDRVVRARCDHLLGCLERDRGRWEKAVEHLDRALETAAESGGPEALARIHLSLADVVLRRADTEAAARHVGEARRLVDRLGDLYAEGKLYSVEARLASLEGKTAEAEDLFAQGVRRLEQLEVPYDRGRSLYEWGLQTPDVELALERVEEALATFARLGAEVEVQRCRGALERIREHRRLGSSRESAPVLYEVGKVINSTLDLEEVLDRTMDLVLERLQAERGMVVLAHPLTRDLEMAVSRNLGQDGAEGRDLSESVVRRVIEQREPVLSADALADQRFSTAESIVASQIRSILAVPLLIRDRVAGAIYIDHRNSRRLFGERELELLRAFADQAAIAIDNARLYGELEAARQRLKEENDQLRREILSTHHLGSLIGRSRAIVELKQTLERVARSNSTVLIRGESGTGKGLVARIIHSVSPRREGAFIQFNCAALPETLVESELFGHERGAFTGAQNLKPGRFELAGGGTIFLDEIGKVSKAVQAKLLRVVEEKEFERVGGTKTLRSDVRIVAATNLDLEEAIERGDFREDLYYRLNIIPIVLPPLRERREDIPYLVQHFLSRISRDLGLPERRLDPAVLELFVSHPWPGNVRELESAIHRALVLSSNELLGPSDFAWIGRIEPGPEPGSPTTVEPAMVVELAEGGYQEALARYDRRLVEVALEQADGRIREAARILGIARNTLKSKMKRYGIDGD